MFGYLLLLTVLALFATAAVAGVSRFPENFHSRLIDTNGTKIFVRADDHGPAVVLLHGFGNYRRDRHVGRRRLPHYGAGG